MEAIHGPIVAVVNLHGMCRAIEGAWLSINLGFEEGLCVNPHMECMPGLLGDLELVGVAALHLFGAVQLNSAALGNVVYQGTVQILSIRRNLQFFLAVRLDFVSVQK